MRDIIGRSDLAAECVQGLSDRELCRSITKTHGVVIERIRVTGEKHRNVTGKPEGTYITATLPPMTEWGAGLEEKAEPLSRELSVLLPERGLVLVAGLGNRSITPDALGPKSAQKVLATRHIAGEAAKSVGLGSLRPVAVLSPGVLGQTGLETIEILRCVCDRIKPSAVLLIDALAAREAKRLGCTVQLCDTGISPGAGVGNDRPEINEKSLGVPTVCIGVPTVIDAGSLSADADDDLMVTPREIDLLIERASSLIAMAVNMSLQPDFDPVDLMNAV